MPESAPEPPAADPVPVLGDLIMAALAATRHETLVVARHYAGRATQAEATAARDASVAAEKAVWVRLLQVAPEEYGDIR